MVTHSLTDDRNYNAQVNCVANFDNGDTVVAGEDGLIKIIYKYDKRGKENTGIKLPETYIEKMLDNSGYLANIEDVKILGSKDIICVETLGNIGIYIKTINKEEESWELKIINSTLQNININSDCIYYLNILSNNDVEIWGEKNIKYKIKIT